MTISQRPLQKNENLNFLMFFINLYLKKEESQIFDENEWVLRKKLRTGFEKLKSINWKKNEKIIK